MSQVYGQVIIIIISTNYKYSNTYYSLLIIKIKCTSGTVPPKIRRRVATDLERAKQLKLYSFGNKT